MKNLYGAFEGRKLVKLTFRKGLISLRKRNAPPFTLDTPVIYVVTEFPEKVMNEFSDIIGYEVLGDAILLEDLN
jgi:hypothetical protein